MGYLAGHYDDTNSVAAFDKPLNRHDHGGNSANDHSDYKAFDFEYTANNRGYYHFLKPGPLGIVLRFTFYRELPTFQPNAKTASTTEPMTPDTLITMRATTTALN